MECASKTAALAKSLTRGHALPNHVKLHHIRQQTLGVQSYIWRALAQYAQLCEPSTRVPPTPPAFNQPHRPLFPWILFRDLDEIQGLESQGSNVLG